MNEETKRIVLDRHWVRAVGAMTGVCIFFALLLTAVPATTTAAGNDATVVFGVT